MEDYLQFDDKCYGASGANTDYTVTSDDSEKPLSFSSNKHESIRTR